MSAYFYGIPLHPASRNRAFREKNSLEAFSCPRYARVLRSFSFFYYTHSLMSGFPFRWFVAAALAWGAVLPVQAEEPPEPDPQLILLEDAIARALQYNRDLLLQALEVDTAELDIARANESVRAFSITPEGSLRATGDGPEGSAGLAASVTVPHGGTIRLRGIATQWESGEDLPAWRRGEVSVEVSQPLFRRFGTLVRNEPVRLATDSHRAALRRMARAQSALVLDVVTAYEELIYLFHQIEADAAFAARMERLAALAEAQERQGHASRTEVLRMALQRGEADARLASGRAELEIATQSFANLLGLALDADFTLQAPALLQLAEVPPERALAVAMLERPDYAQALEEIRIGGRKKRLAQRELLPDIRLVARHTRYAEGGEWHDARRLDETDWAVGLQADMDLNLRGARLGVRRAEMTEESLKQTAEITRYRLALEVNSALMNYRRTRAELALAESNRELAAGRSELAGVLFAGNRATANTVSDAEADLILKELEALAVRRNASIAAYRVLHVLGTLLPAPPELLEEAPGV